MKVTIEGSLEQVAEALSAAPIRPRTARQTRLKENAEARDALIAKRRVIRRAFECVRWSKEDKEDSDILLAALTKPGCLTESAMETARRVLAVGHK